MLIDVAVHLGRSDQSTPVREAAIVALSSSAFASAPEHRAAIIETLAALTDDSDSRIREKAALWMPVRTQGDASMTALEQFLRDPNPKVRAAAAASMLVLSMSSDDTVSIFRKHLTDEDATVRWCAVIAIGRAATRGLDVGDAVEVLFDIARTDASSGIRGRALMSICGIKPVPPGTLELIQAFFDSSTDLLRVYALDAAFAMRAESVVAVPLLLRGLNDESKDVRFGATIAVQDPMYVTELAKHREQLNAILKERKDDEEVSLTIRDVLQSIDRVRTAPASSN